MMTKQINGKTEILAVFGDPISHSLSPAMHNAAFHALEMNCCYIPLQVPVSLLPDAVRGIRAMNIRGVNVTIPHKQAVVAEMDEILGDSRYSGSVNTILHQNGKLCGTSTDGIGLVASLRGDGQFEPEGANVVLLGAGGTAAAVVYRLVEEGVRNLILVNRSIENANSLQQNLWRQTGFRAEVRGLEELTAIGWGRQNLLINTTSVGLVDDLSPVPSGCLHSGLFVYDVVYRPGGSTLIKEATICGCRTLSGLSMLLYQGAASFRLWFGVDPPLEVMRAAISGT